MVMLTKAGQKHRSVLGTMTVVFLVIVVVAVAFCVAQSVNLNKEKINAQREKAALEQAVEMLKTQNTTLSDQVDHVQELVDKVTQENSDLKEKLETTQRELDEVKRAAETFSKATALNTTADWKAVEQGSDAPWQEVKATAYSAFCPDGCNGITATGFNIKNPNIDHRVIAVDPKVIPLYSIVEIKGLGFFKAMDTGGAIKGNRVDILVNSLKAADQFGTKHLDMRIVRAGPY